jgi:hypothetical protein
MKSQASELATSITIRPKKRGGGLFLVSGRVSLKSPKKKIHQGENGGRYCKVYFGGPINAAPLSLSEGIDDSRFSIFFLCFLCDICEELGHFGLKY